MSNSKRRCRSEVVVILSVCVAALVLLVVWTWQICWAGTTSAGVIRVATGGVDTPTCGSEAAPCRTVQYAVDLAQEGDEIRVAGGVYTDVHTRTKPPGYTGSNVITQVLYISKTVTVRGGYHNANWFNPDTNANPTALDAQGLGRVIFIAREMDGHLISPTISGLRITGGNAERQGGVLTTMDAGGGLFINPAAARIEDCLIYSNTASVSRWGYGGGLYVRLSEATLVGNHIYSNTASQKNIGNGGGAFLSAGPVTFSANEVKGNTASAAPLSSFSSGHGGGLYIVGTNMIVRGNIVENNVAGQIVGGTGGGVKIDTAFTFLAEDNRIRHNLASGSGNGDGGGLYIVGSSGTLNRNIVISNTATLSVTGTGLGGGIWMTGTNLTAVNNVINENDARSAGSGLWIGRSPSRWTHTTIADNGGVRQGVYVSLTTLLYFTNTIVADHTTGIAAAAGSTATLLSTLWYDNVTTSVGSGAVISTSNNSGDPVFDSDGYHLTAGSAAIDLGVLTGALTDVDNEPRVYGAADLGADEYWPPGALKRAFLPVVCR